MTKTMTCVQITDRKPTESRPSGVRLHWLEEDSEFLQRVKKSVKKQTLQCSFTVSDEVQVPVHVCSEAEISAEPAESEEAA